MSTDSAVAAVLRQQADLLDPPSHATPLRPFSDQSRWNSKPQGAVLGTYILPNAQYFPSIEVGIWSTQVFVPIGNEGPKTVLVIGQQPITIENWPLATQGAIGADGHADIIDPVTRKIHSFWQLRLDQSTGKWQCAAYAWMPLDGSGFATPDRPYQGTRAAGVPPCAGLIRSHEAFDGLDVFKHALAMALPPEALSGTVGHVLPVLTHDYSLAGNIGQLSEGSFLMLPPNFDLTLMATPAMKKVAKTFMTYGGYVVDRNYGTPWEVYAEIGSGFNVMPAGWDNGVANSLRLIQTSLRPVNSVASWIDANGAAFNL